jgi:hypothetical protein
LNEYILYKEKKVGVALLQGWGSTSHTTSEIGQSELYCFKDKAVEVALLQGWGSRSHTTSGIGQSELSFFRIKLYCFIDRALDPAVRITSDGDTFARSLVVIRGQVWLRIGGSIVDKTAPFDFDAK